MKIGKAVLEEDDFVLIFQKATVFNKSNTLTQKYFACELRCFTFYYLLKQMTKPLQVTKLEEHFR